MVKMMTLYSPAEGIDPEEMWKYHTQIHAEEIKASMGSLLKRYTLNRVVEVVRGEPKFWGLVELWFDSKADAKEAFARSGKYVTPEGKATSPAFRSRVKDMFVVEVEEKEIIK